MQAHYWMTQMHGRLKSRPEFETVKKSNNGRCFDVC